MLVIPLKPLGPFHLQTGGLDHERVDPSPKSDTLSAALMHLWARQFGSIPGLPDQPPFVLSSVFPLIRIENGTQNKKLFPKPRSLSFHTFKKDRLNDEEFGHKDFKRIQWVDEELFLLMLDKSKQLSAYVPKSRDDSHLWFNGTVWCKQPCPPQLKSSSVLKEHELTRVVLDRDTNAATPFHFVTTNFPEHTCLYVLVEIDEEYRAQFMTLLRLLGDEGIGADRTVGLGQFEVENEIEEWTPPKAPGHSAWISLGVFNPVPQSQKKINWENSSYDLINRSGWVTEKALRRRSVKMISEGSVLVSPEKPEGRLVNVLDKDAPDLIERHREFLSDIVQLEHPVYRDGRTILLPMNLNQP